MSESRRLRRDERYGVCDDDVHEFIGAGRSDAQHLRHHLCVEEQRQFLVAIVGS